MSEPTSKTGMWIRISDGASARYAMRMSGLSAFWLGLNGLIFAVFVVMASPGQRLNYQFIGIVAGIGLLMIVVAFMIRAGQFWLVPVTSVVSVVLLVLALISGGGYQALVALMALGLSVAGLRGWIWLKRYPEA